MSLSDPMSTGSASSAASASSNTPPLFATALEGELKSATSGIIYPNINSCMTITFLLGDDTLLGAHCVQVPDQLQLNSQELVEKAKKDVQAKGVKEIVIMGDQGWSLRSFNPSQPDSEFLTRDKALAIYFAKVFQTPNVRFADAHGTLSVTQKDRTLMGQENGSELILESPWEDGYVSYRDVDSFLSMEQ